jgi:predicted transcriptional regulator
VITLASVAQGLYTWAAPAQPLASDISVITGHAGCKFYTKDATYVTTDVAYAPPTDYWGNSLKPANAYLAVTTSGAGFSIATAANVQSFSTNAADNAAFRIRGGAPDVNHANRTLAGVTIFSIGLGDVDAVLLKRIANDKSLVPNPVAAGDQGLYVYAADATQLDQAFTRVASEMLRLAK